MDTQGSATQTVREAAALVPAHRLGGLSAVSGLVLVIALVLLIIERGPPGV